MTAPTPPETAAPRYTRYTLPAAIFRTVPPPPAPGKYDNTRKMLTSPVFWLVMVVLTAAMFGGALMLAEHFRATSTYTPVPAGELHYALG